MDKQRKDYVIGHILFNTRDIVDRIKSISGILHDLDKKEKEIIINELYKDKYFKALEKNLGESLIEVNKLTIFVKGG